MASGICMVSLDPLRGCCSLHTLSTTNTDLVPRNLEHVYSTRWDRLPPTISEYISLLQTGVLMGSDRISLQGQACNPR